MKVGETMSEKQTQKVFQLCSFLLCYPDNDYYEALEEVEEELLSVSIPSIQKELYQFCQKAKQLSLHELISTYVYTFDFGKKSNLYITYMSNGEQRERGMDLLFLKNYYKQYGFGMTDKELPDYLPIMLEFASQVEIEIYKPIFERYFINIKEIEGHLDPEQNLFGHILKSIILALEHADITEPVRRSEEICSTNFSGKFSPILS